MYASSDKLSSAPVLSQITVLHQSPLYVFQCIYSCVCPNIVHYRCRALEGLPLQRGGPKRLCCLTMVPKQLPLLAWLALLLAAASLAAATAPTRLPALWDASHHEPMTTPPAANGSAAGSSASTLHAHGRHIHPLQPHWWSRGGALYSNHLSATNAKRRLSQATSNSRSAADLLNATAIDKGGGSPNSVPDYIYPLDSYVQSGGAVPKGYLWYPLDTSKDLPGVLNSMENITEAADDALESCDFGSTPVYNGACCAITSYEANIDGCMVVSVFPDVGLADELHDWTGRLPVGVMYLDLSKLNLTRGLPVSFGNAAASLEVLDISGNNFTGTLPQ